MKLRILAGCVAIAAASSGCAAMKDFGHALRLNSPAGAGDLAVRHSLHKVDMVTLVDPDKLGGWASDQSIEEQVSHAAIGFYRYSDHEPVRKPDGEYITYQNDKDLILRRNYIQDQIMATADERCRFWQNYFATGTSTVSFGLGSLATGFAGLGATFADAETVRALSALAGISSGVRAEFDKAYLHERSLQVIFKGIEIRRDKIRAQIYARRGESALGALNVSGAVVAQTERSNAGATQSTATAGPGGGEAPPQPGATPTEGSPAPAADRGVREPAWRQDEDEDLRIYTLQRAVADALVYHSACSMAAGLEVASESMSQVQNPGIETFIAQSQRLRAALNGQETPPPVPGGAGAAGGAADGDAPPPP